MKIDYRAFFIEEALYRPQTFTKNDIETIWNLLTEPIQIDAYCKHCNRDSIFQGPKKDLDFKLKPSLPLNVNFGSEEEQKLNFIIGQKFFTREFFCQRKNKGMPLTFRINFNITILPVSSLKEEYILMKTGQFPSLADLMFPDLDKYHKVLPSEKMKELKTGLRLGANGLGIGSFTYVRRIFEYLIETAHKEAAEKVAGWDETAFQIAKIKEKINMIKEYLPEFVVQNKEIYGILSGGIHTYEEELCLEMFPIMKRGIIAMLEAKYREMEQQKEFDEVSKSIAKLNSRLGELTKEEDE